MRSRTSAEACSVARRAVAARSSSAAARSDAAISARAAWSNSFHFRPRQRANALGLRRRSHSRPPGAYPEFPDRRSRVSRLLRSARVRPRHARRQPAEWNSRSTSRSRENTAPPPCGSDRRSRQRPARSSASERSCPPGCRRDRAHSAPAPAPAAPSMPTRPATAANQPATVQAMPAPFALHCTPPESTALAICSASSLLDASSSPRAASVSAAMRFRAAWISSVAAARACCTTRCAHRARPAAPLPARRKFPPAPSSMPRDTRGPFPCAAA